MKLESGNISQRLQGYTGRCREYLQNAYTSLEQNEVEKAGEFLWGSMTQAIKAVAAIKNIELRSHAAIWEYARGLSKDLENPAFDHAFTDANSLHINFYESGLTREIVLTSGERIGYAVGMLLDMIPREALEG